MHSTNGPGGQALKNCKAIIDREGFDIDLGEETAIEAGGTLSIRLVSPRS